MNFYTLGRQDTYHCNPLNYTIKHTQMGRILTPELKGSRNLWRTNSRPHKNMTSRMTTSFETRTLGYSSLPPPLKPPPPPPPPPTWNCPNAADYFKYAYGVCMCVCLAPYYLHKYYLPAGSQSLVFSQHNLNLSSSLSAALCGTTVNNGSPRILTLIQWFSFPVL